VSSRATVRSLPAQNARPLPRDHERADLVIGPYAVDVVRELAHHCGIMRIQLFWSIKAKPSARAFVFVEHLIHRIPVPPYMGSGRCGRASLVPRPAPYS
jgi:hypothetical protein